MAASRKRRLPPPPPPPTRGFGGADNPFAATWERRAANATARAGAARAAERARNAFADRRIGEDDAGVPEEERYVMRVQKARASRATKRARFGLYGEEAEAETTRQVDGFGLTHRGVEIAKGGEQKGGRVSILRDDYVEIGEDDGDEEEVEEVLGSGGMEDGKGLLQRKDGGGVGERSEEAGSEEEGEGEGQGTERRTRQEIMAEVVAKSKMHKADRQREKAHVDEETSALDKQLPDILRMLGSSGMRGDVGDGEDDGVSGSGLFEVGEDRGKTGVGGRGIVKCKVSVLRDGGEEGGAEERFNYEQVYLELAGEKRAYATDRTKTQDEKDAEERARLEALEKLRLHRMSAIDDEDAAPEEDARKRRRGKKAKAGMVKESAHVGGDDLEDDFAIGDGGSASEDGRGSGFSSNDGEGGDESDGSDDESGGGKGHGGNASMPLAGSRAKGQQLAGMVPDPAAAGEDGSLSDFKWAPPPSAATAPDDTLPFVYTTCPQSYDALAVIFRGLTASQCGVAMSRLRKCFALSLNPAVNKGILAALLRATLQLFDVASLAVSTDASSLTAAVAQVDVLLPHVYELATVAPDLVVAWARNHVEDAYRETGDAAHDATVGLSARLSVGRIISLRSIARMFPGSDLRHAIMTPLGLLLSHCVSSVPVLTLEDASTACFCASLLVEVLSPAKRFSGELICFLGAMLSTAIPDGKGVVAEVDRRRVRNDLLLGAGRKQAGVLGLGDCFDSSPPGEETGSSSKCHRKMKQQRILNALYSLSRACLYDGGLNSLREATFPVVRAASALHVSKVCDSSLLDEIETLATKQEEARKPLTLYAEKKGAFVARLLNPKFRSENGVYAGKQRSAGGVAMSDMETQRKLRQQLKKEARSAARELRRDAEAKGAMQIRNEDERDAIRTANGAQARAFMERQQHDSKLQSKKVAVGREGLAAAGRKRKKW